jgi:sulfur transfer protein SufE
LEVVLLGKIFKWLFDSCKHEWKLYEECESEVWWDAEHDKYPYKSITVKILQCTKCGIFKKQRFKL